jgi:hypothetical protein
MLWYFPSPGCGEEYPITYMSVQFSAMRAVAPAISAVVVHDSVCPLSGGDFSQCPALTRYDRLTDRRVDRHGKNERVGAK